MRADWHCGWLLSPKSRMVLIFQHDFQIFNNHWRAREVFLFLSCISCNKQDKQRVNKIWFSGSFYFSNFFFLALTNSKIDFNDETIRNLIIDELEYLDTRMNFWQQQKPLYSHRRKTTAKSAIARSGSKDILSCLEEVDDCKITDFFSLAWMVEHWTKCFTVCSYVSLFLVL